MRFHDILPKPKELADAIIRRYKDCRDEHIAAYEKAREDRKERGVIAVGFCGPSRSGKDAAAEIWASLTGCRISQSLSGAGLEFIYDELPDNFQIGELSSRANVIAWLYLNRHAHDNPFFLKETWDRFREYDPLVLVRKVLTKGDTVTGTRHLSELEAYYPDYVQEHIWIQRDVPNDPTLDYSQVDVPHVVMNDSTLAELAVRLKVLVDKFALKHNLATKGS